MPEYVVEAGSGASLDPLTSRLSDARRVFIATYHLGDLVERIKECPPEADVTIFSNVPKRFSSYWGAQPKSRAKAAIDAATRLLDPKQFKCRLHAYFAMENHVKLVVVDDLAYLGSANFGDQDSPNVEAGVLIENADEIEELIERVRERLLESPLTFPFVKGPALDLHGELAQTIDDLEAIVDHADYLLYDDPPCGPWNPVFRPNMHENHNVIATKLTAWADDVASLLERWSEALDDWFAGPRAEARSPCEDLVDTARSCADDLPKSLQRLATFDFQRDMESAIARYSGQYDELDEAYACAESDVQESFDEIVNGWEDEDGEGTHLAPGLEKEYPVWRPNVVKKFRDAVKEALLAVRKVAIAEGLDNTA